MRDSCGLGKVILLGEHSVVFGHAAIAGAIDLSVRCTAYPCDETSRLSIPQWNLSISAEEESPVAQAMRSIQKVSGSSNLRIEGQADLPSAAGLGSSAALSVALAKLWAPQADLEEIEALAAHGEKAFHDTPSGVDVAISIRGGIGIFCPGKKFHTLPCPPLPLVIALSRTKRKTIDMVKKVAKSFESSNKTKSQIEKLGQIAQQGQHVLLDSDLTKLGTLMNQSHQILGSLGVSIPKLDAMVHCARKAGAIGAKLTGAGGGGAIIALAPGNQEQVCQSLRGEGYQAFQTTVGAAND